jgi:integrase
MVETKKSHTRQEKREMGSRRGRGEGSIYEVPGRGWRGAVSTGNCKRKILSGKTRSEVADKINEELQKQRKGIVSTPERLTVEKYLTEWLRDTIKPRNVSNTFCFYESLVRVHLIPALGKIRLSKLSPMDVKRMLNQRRESGLTPRTIQAIHATLKSALSEAQRMEILHRNVAMLVQTDDSKQIEETKRRFVILTPVQMASFVDAMNQHRWKNFLLLSMTTGIRRAEVCALGKEHFDRHQRTLKIHRTISSVRRDGTRISILKGGSKRKREIHLTQTAYAALLDEEKLQQQEREKAGDKWREQGYLFTSERGDRWHPDTASRMFKEIAASVGLPEEMTIHDLRHNFASQLLAKGTHAKLVQAQLGHSRVATTLDIYSHVIPEAGREVADTFEAVMQEGRKQLRQLKRPIAATIATRPTNRMVQ